MCAIFPESYIQIVVGLIRWKLVMHAFIDGKTRYVTGARIHNNNRASSVLALFLEAIELHGIPDMVRGDHGVENAEVARKMAALMRLYIWGR